MLRLNQLNGFGTTLVTGGAVAIEHVHEAEMGGNPEPVTFSSASLGSAEAKKIVVCAMGGPSDATVSSMTVDGNSATQWIIYNPGSEWVAIWHVNLNTETSGDIVVDLSQTIDSIGIDVFKVLNASDTLQDSANSGLSDPATTTLDVAANGGVIAVQNQRTNSASTITWTGVSKSAGKGSSSRLINSFIYGSAASEVYDTADGTKTITADSDQAGIRDERMACVSIAPA